MDVGWSLRLTVITDCPSPSRLRPAPRRPRAWHPRPSAAGLAKPRVSDARNSWETPAGPAPQQVPPAARGGVRGGLQLEKGPQPSPKATKPVCPGPSGARPRGHGRPAVRRRTGGSRSWCVCGSCSERGTRSGPWSSDVWAGLARAGCGSYLHRRPQARASSGVWAKSGGRDPWALTVTVLGAGALG